MTVHGAKGLEAPSSSCRRLRACTGADPILLDPGAAAGLAHPCRSGRRAETDDSDAIAGGAGEAAGARPVEEHNRLLYVAMTRAEDRLVIAPLPDQRQGPCRPKAWYGDDPRTGSA